MASGATPSAPMPRAVAVRAADLEIGYLPADATGGALATQSVDELREPRHAIGEAREGDLTLELKRHAVVGHLRNLRSPRVT